ncbi:MAG: phosphatidylserine decarboxylase family protein [Nitrospinaceae bacterium]
MRIPIAPDGYRFILPLLVLTVLALYMDWNITAALSFLALVFVTNFFRDPERTIPQTPGAVVSPADGKVMEIVQDKDEMLDQPGLRVSIFLNVFNVHINRIPATGTVEEIRYNKGKFLNAASHRASQENEHTSIRLRSGPHQILFKQIAGLIARRIVCYAQPGQSFSRGDRFGLIRFGSRADLFLPLGSRVEVSVGDHVRGGSSIIGYLPEGD